jgi:hypothetical protein
MTYRRIVIPLRPFVLAGVESFLQAFEGPSHAHDLRDANAPETEGK